MATTTRSTDPQTLCVIYRTGGTFNFRWNRSIGYATREEAQAALESVRRMGYEAHLANYRHSLSVGLPEGYFA